MSEATDQTTATDSPPPSPPNGQPDRLWHMRVINGMNAFIPSVENMGLLEPATSLPTQIFSWADSPERGFVSRTSAAILVLLGFLLIMNVVAIALRQMFQRKW